MPDAQTIHAGVRKGVKRLLAQQGSVKAVSDKVGLPEWMINRILSDSDDWNWGIGAHELIAKALGIRLDQLTTGDF